MTAGKKSKKPPASFGPIQLARRLGWFEFQVWRAVELGLLPRPDLGRRWSARLVERFEARADAVRAEIGELPDLGAFRASVVLSARFGFDVSVDAVLELAQRGVFPTAGEYKGALLYCGRAVERFSAVELLRDAAVVGRCVRADEAAERLRIRRSDFDHLRRAGLVAPSRWVRGEWKSWVALYRVGDLDALAVDQGAGIDWVAVRDTPRGRPSLLAKLPTATNSDIEDAVAEGIGQREGDTTKGVQA